MIIKNKTKITIHVMGENKKGYQKNNCSQNKTQQTKD